MRTLIFAAAVLMAGEAYAAPVTYTLDPAHTEVALSVDRVGFNLLRAAWGSTTASGLVGDQVSITIEALAEVPPAAQP